MTDPAKPPVRNHHASKSLQTAFLKQAPALHGYALGLTGDPALADDAVQECFLTVESRAGTFTPGTDFAAWARTIVRFKVLELLRFRNRSGCFGDELIALLAEEAPPPDVWEAEQQALADCIRHLAPKARHVIELRYLDGLSPEAISTRISWTVNAVHVALSRARSALRRCITMTLERNGVGGD